MRLYHCDRFPARCCTTSLKGTVYGPLYNTAVYGGLLLYMHPTAKHPSVETVIFSQAMDRVVRQLSNQSFGEGFTVTGKAEELPRLPIQHSS